uniref:Uncharacterized protein n=1 Tax=Glossina pallidipes TaxID=7398 RepID=A0A1A9ZUN9_GLOPL
MIVLFYTIKIVGVKVHRMEVLAKNFQRHCDISDTAFKVVLEAVEIKQFCTLRGLTGLEELLQYSQKHFSALGMCNAGEHMNRSHICNSVSIVNILIIKFIIICFIAIYSIKLLALNVIKDGVDIPNMGA